jgi:hypothetical protein
MDPGRVRHLHRLMVIAKQPGGLRTLSDDELMVWAGYLRTGLAAAEDSKRRKKARRGWRDQLDLAEAESARREPDGA